MRLFELALSAHDRKVRADEIAYTEGVKHRTKKAEQLVEQTFGLPFHEAFDVSKVEIANEGYTLIVDEYVYLHWNEDGLEIQVYEPGVKANLIGQARFPYLGKPHHESNLIGLGALLAVAHLTPSNGGQRRHD